MSESDLFEYFAAFCIVSSTYEEEFDTAHLDVGGETTLDWTPLRSPQARPPVRAAPPRRKTPGMVYRLSRISSSIA